MEFYIISIVGIVLVLSMTTLFYMYLVETENKNHMSYTRNKTRGNFWDAETKKFYKWDELMELKKKKGKKNDTT